jgi:hypothetical protein
LRRQICSPYASREKAWLGRFRNLKKIVDLAIQKKIHHVLYGVPSEEVCSEAE